MPSIIMSVRCLSPSGSPAKAPHSGVPYFLAFASIAPTLLRTIMEPRHACRVAGEHKVLYFLLADVRFGTIMLRLGVVAYASLRGRSASATTVQIRPLLQHFTSL